MARPAMSLVLLSILVAIVSLVQGTDELIMKIQPGSEKVTHLRFYFHDIVSGNNPTSITIAKAANTMKSATMFGAVNVIDNALTLGTDPNSEPVGRAQGPYVLDGMSEFNLLMAMDLAFTNGKYSGSSPRMPIVGGTGVFQLTRGFVTLKTYEFNTTSGNAIVQYDVTAIHY